MELSAGELTINELDAADFDDPVALPRLQAGGLRIQHDLPQSRPRLLRRLHGVNGRVRRLIDPLVVDMAAVPLDPAPLYLVPVCLAAQAQP